MSDQATVLDLFCGAGGLSRGLEMAGLRVAGGVETDPRAWQTFALNHPDAAAFGGPTDIRDLSADDVWRATGLAPGELDVVAGGPPCQGFSMAGYRRTDDVRNSLVFQYVRLLAELRPRFFVMENVVGLTSMTVDGRRKVLAALAQELDRAGYATNIPSRQEDWRALVVDSADFGVPQHRRRVLVFGARDGEGGIPALPERTHSGPPDAGRLPFDDAGLLPHVSVHEALSDLPEPSAEEPVALEEPESPSEFARLMRSPDARTWNHVPTRHAARMVERMREQANGTPLYDTWAHAWYRLVPDEPSPTVKENHNAPFVHHLAPRVVTPRECARLQSFPDDHRFVGPKSRVLVQVGNAVPPLLGRVIGEALLERLRGVAAAPSKGEATPARA